MKGVDYKMENQQKEILLTIGEWTNDQIAAFMGIKEGTLKQTRAKKLKDLEEYAEFKIQRGKINITKVLDPGPYELPRIRNSAKRITHEAFPKMWREYDTCVRCATEIKTTHQLPNKVKTIAGYVGQERMEAYGSPIADKKSKGTKGKCHYVWAKNIKGIEFHPMTAEEQKYYNQVIDEVYGHRNEKKEIAERNLIRDAYKKGAISKEDYDAIRDEWDEKEWNMWQQVLSIMITKYQIELKRVTHSEETEY